MIAATQVPGLNEISRQAASGSPFPQVLPPRYPANKVSTAGLQSSNHGAAQLVHDVNNVAAEIHHPLITAADYSDRRQLLSHITVLSGQLQRAQLLLRNTPSCVVSDADIARFDPLIAQAEVERLDSALAQLSLLHEMERARSGSLEAEQQQLREERNQLVARVDTLESRSVALETENVQLRSALEVAQQELQVLRVGESALGNKLHAIEQLQRDGGRFDGVNVVIAPPRAVCSTAAKELQLQENIQRLSLLLDMMMDPMYIAFDAGVVWITETEHHRAGGQVCGAALSNAPHDSEELTTTVGGNSPLGNASDATLPQDVVANPPHVVASEVDISLLQQQQQELCRQLDAVRESCRVAERNQERLQDLLLEEQRRTEAMAQEHCKQLQCVHDRVVHERRQVVESLVAEVEEKMRNAFRDGRLYQKQLDERLIHRRSSSTFQSRSGHSSARSTPFASRHKAFGGNGTCKGDGDANSSRSARSPILGG
ncbi:uncharacterized protein TEOVI_000250300 [Trypanosoma equiperdum]|uniref:Uncharacterized protein n=4 Tax=Trypanozoon TaxID=39700 RepID=Q57YN1_TRYB2|nr:hypothetical protein, conserved [Trypanosoma brucei gambiense DAL972]XP_847460.1 hypothetical protein, conserved [Trypanosoma brucei brucei TREU927]AAX69311.1 hypothetical protein, conserved [Trypanosoma brucei]RHW72924.1 hypothetical protein DPX39_040054500 [Trypanosoma brucei equiperdum]SCU70928.1 hypothetical protein, conserved [Trypanosoma equiperdum]AAZ13394.1 hypothetical protein, conserved [Trypanosoma brucei brucei TREU927]CBH13698.1 hypothetical protein, conserved [Trypanosoma bru|eukprot:XP_011775974.1 hypothetical protein, conserved [Trypanosoma brucei gambiense DAL972]